MSQEQREFKGYSEDQMKRIASKLGHTGGLDTFDTYLTSNQNALSKYNALKDNIKKMYAGGYVNKYAVGGDVTGQIYYTHDQMGGYNAPIRKPGMDFSYNKSEPVLDSLIDCID